jgi:hypothetical protein
MIFLEKDLLLSRRSGSSFVEQIIRPQTASLLAFDENKLPVVIPSSSLVITSASYALSASYASNGGTGGSGFPFSGSAVITGSLFVTDRISGSFTGSLLGTSSYALTSLTASYALNGSDGPNPSLVKVQNGAGFSLLRGQVVQVIGSNLSGELVVDLAVSKIHTPGSTVTSDVLGVVSDVSILNGSVGNILITGYLEGLNTNTGFSAGDVLYLSPSVSGSFTNIKPSAPRDVVKIGYITVVDTFDGGIFVDLKQPVTIDEISNISSSASPSNGAFLVYNAVDGVWEDKSSGLVLSGSLSASNADVGNLMAGTVVVSDLLTSLDIHANNNVVAENDITVGRDILVERQIIASGSSAPFRVVSKVDGTNVLYVTGSRVGINKDDPQFNLEVNGSFAATTKSFVIDHQKDETKRLVHASLEGPEHGVFVRGRSNSLCIDLPDYWPWLVDENSISIHITPIGRPDVYYVEKIKDNKVYINVDRKVGLFKKLFNKESYDFYYMINAERKDVDKLQTIIDKTI